jgi:hypothetical protein
VDRPRKDRIAKNEALFRDINDRVKQIDEAREAPTDELRDFLCECGRRDCFERVAMTLAEYERVRSSPVQFAVLPGHEAAAVERVVEETRRFAVIEKHADEQQVALETDPRP